MRVYEELPVKHPYGMPIGRKKFEQMQKKAEVLKAQSQAFYAYLKYISVGEEIKLAHGRFRRADSFDGGGSCLLAARHCSSIPLDRFGRMHTSEAIKKTAVVYVYADHCVDALTGERISVSRERVLKMLEPNDTNYFEILAVQVEE